MRVTPLPSVLGGLGHNPQTYGVQLSSRRGLPEPSGP